MAKENIAPTKSNLLKVKERLSIAEEGYDLLEQKREILVMELMRTVEQVKILERDMERRRETAYPAVRAMLARVGSVRANLLARSVRYHWTLSEKRQSIAGIDLPALEIHAPTVELKYPLANSFAECDEVVLEFFEFLKALTESATVRTVAWRLAREVRKTQRRVNALEKVVIPTAVETKVFIEASLEERDRESFFASKLLKRKAEQRE